MLPTRVNEQWSEHFSPAGARPEIRIIDSALTRVGRFAQEPLALTAITAITPNVYGRNE